MNENKRKRWEDQKKKKRERKRGEKKMYLTSQTYNNERYIDRN